jgi:protein-glutamine gamma-glutamyltransferase
VIAWPRLRIPGTMKRVVAPVEPTLGFRNLAWLELSVALVAAPHAERIPPWITLMCCVLFAWRLYLARLALPLPRGWLLLVLSAAATFGIYLSYGTVFGRNPGVALLLLLIALKLMEMRTLRDAMLVAFLGYFLVITNFLYSQTIPTALYMLAVVFVITFTLVGFNCLAGTPPLAARLRLAGVLLAQSAPLMLVLFVFFPRVQGPIWGLPRDAAAGTTGLSDTMAPGTLSQLTLSDDVAFRVYFPDGPPPLARLYWRGPVMEDYDGRTWSVGRPLFVRRPEIESFGVPLRYEVTLEPHNKPWIFAMEMPVTLPPKTRLSENYQLLSFAPVRNRMRYEVTSYPAFRIGLKEAPAELARALALPEGFNPRARELAQGWRRETREPEEVVQRALALFRNEPFAYTLQPPLLGANGVDDFLFETRRGFCEHYASAFTFLMRAAGIPARAVTGYQGGELNPIGNYLIVRQADAHAWSEVWLEGQGWVRVDPTAAVAPERVESGLAAALPAGEPLPFTMRNNLVWLMQLRLTWDSLAFRWNQWVLGYGPERQLEFLTRAGMRTPDWKSMAAWLLGGAGLLMFCFAAWMLRQLDRGTHDPVLAAWLRFCRKLEKAGSPRRPGEGPRDYAERVRRARPGLAAAVDQIASLYIALRYGVGASRDDERRLRRLVAEFKLRD